MAAFGDRRVIVGACVLAMHDALHDAGGARSLPLRNCGVDAGTPPLTELSVTMAVACR